MALTILVDVAATGVVVTPINYSIMEEADYPLKYTIAVAVLVVSTEV